MKRFLSVPFHLHNSRRETKREHLMHNIAFHFAAKVQASAFLILVLIFGTWWTCLWKLISREWLFKKGLLCSCIAVLNPIYQSMWRRINMKLNIVETFSMHFSQIFKCLYCRPYFDNFINLKYEIVLKRGNQIFFSHKKKDRILMLRKS